PTPSWRAAAPNLADAPALLQGQRDFANQPLPATEPMKRRLTVSIRFLILVKIVIVTVLKYLFITRQ
ncbi:MAG: hypothetical protein FWG59_02015, partial [Betaproteobacteria bacterium]|nr:hypothetical protein [Betaproteobacteria bacterium]